MLPSARASPRAAIFGDISPIWRFFNDLGERKAAFGQDSYRYSWPWPEADAPAATGGGGGSEAMAPPLAREGGAILSCGPTFDMKEKR